ncbi:hypothetical protein GWI33_017504 [Rhynchophorus ferrugineus]|uniref:Ionotropic receptor n=1 Tax=Rhynchophorus ferrugineus TaxID=354439 RepID=A0A834HYK9_RHYFE|nr:hypothetical protein GWI33_017504 [Rhynchophorus ferrugineus]
MWRNTTIRVYERVIYPFVTEEGDGLEQLYIGNVLQSLGMTKQAYIKNYTYQGLKKRNGTYENQGLRMLYLRQADLVIGKYHAVRESPHWPNEFDGSVIYMVDGVHFIVPKSLPAGYLSKMAHIINPFYNLMLFIVIGLWSGIVAFLYDQNFFHMLFITFKIIHGVSVRGLSTKYNFRLLLSIWILCLFVLTTVFQTFLVSMCSDLHFKPDLNTVKDIIDSKLPIKATIDIFQVYKHTMTKDDGRLFKILEKCINYMHCLREICYNRSSVTIGSRMSFLFAAQHLCPKDDTGLLRIHVGPQVYSAYTRMYFSKGYPAFWDINRNIERLFLYGGIIRRETRRMEMIIGRIYSTKKIISRTLSINELKYFFWMFLGLLVISVLIFFGEICFDKYKQINKKHHVMKKYPQTKI